MAKVKSKDKSTKATGSGGKSRPDFVTPEYIAAQRLKREQAKAEKARLNAELGVVPADQVGFNTSFIERPVLRISKPVREADGDQVDLKIMTYNVLGQALIRRKLFPTNGNALKWRWRSKVLLGEFKFYNPDIMCLQEVDLAHLSTFYIPELKKLGYDVLYHRGDRKNHGLLIAWKRGLIRLVDSLPIAYDTDTGYDHDNAGNENDHDNNNSANKRPSTKPQMNTRNVGLLASLEFVSTPGKGLIIGTTHLFWHPFGTLERTRQCAILLRRAINFQSQHDLGQWPLFLAGDFNSMPIDSPYLGLTRPAGPERDTNEALQILHESYEHEYKKKDIEEEEEEEEGDDEEDEDGENEEAILNNAVTAKTSTIPLPRAKSSSSSISGMAIKSTPQEVLRLHDNNSARLKSLYGEFYRYVHPENATADRNYEPAFSNWAHAWRGLLDYIFVADFHSGHATTDSEIVPNVQVLELLRLPEPHEMGQEPSGQPREGQYPSDHLCLMAKIRIDLV
ncbi:Endonuclease/exonuclease/phosphatase [Lipomyces japonicus]|uniref:Endonuclease/exonuclease/phosphatase n=1 Tax=Lipomyces japonicus TaxID=56871 RepID=UPI0034CE3224